MTHRTLVLLIVFALVSIGYSQGADKERYILRDFVVDAAIVSYMPGEGIDAYENQGSGMVSGRGTLGLGVRIDDQSRMINLRPRTKERSLLLEVEIEHRRMGRRLERLRTEPLKTLDLTDLKPTVIPLGTAKDGRVYQVNVNPRVRVLDKTPRRFNVDDFELHEWTFPDCPIMLNDSQYVGGIHCSQGPVGKVDITGVVSLAFSLQQVEGWKPWGVLHNGILVVTNPEDESSIKIRGVLNGGHRIKLPGGPYRVWADWAPSQSTPEAHREKLLAIRERLVSGELESRPGRLASLDKQLARPLGPWAVSTGVRSYRSDEKVVDP